MSSTNCYYKSPLVNKILAERRISRRDIERFIVKTLRIFTEIRRVSYVGYTGR